MHPGFRPCIGLNQARHTDNLTTFSPRFTLKPVLKLMRYVAQALRKGFSAQTSRIY
jgi:hypothetical protein